MESYSAKFYRHVWKFMEETNLISKKASLAVSGGPDSMALLGLFLEARKRRQVTDLEVIHIDHGARQESADEAQKLKLFCQKNQVALKSFEGKLSLKLANFEKEARDLREFYYKRASFPLFQGHHLDDSWEWAFMQAQKSSKLCLGIPVLAENKRRPFLCVTKKHILYFLRKQKVPYWEDASNNDLRFERNFIRHKVRPLIQAKYPQYLKHYAYRANNQAKSLGVSAFSSRPGGEEVSSVQCQKTGLISFSSKSSDASLKRHIEAELYRLNPKSRGSYAKELAKLMKLIESKRGPFPRGPMTFPGEVKVYIYADHLEFFSKHA